MSQSDRMSLTAVTEFADAYEGHIAPQAEFSGDLEGIRFCRAATLTVPKLLQLLERSTGEGAFTHFVVDVFSEFFAEHHDWEYNVNVKIAGIFSGNRLFHKWYRRHQFLIPIQLLSAATNRVELAAEATRAGESDGAQISFEVAIALIAKPRLWESLERSAIWLFSTARSGSTWLAIDILCSGKSTRPVDESGNRAHVRAAAMGCREIFRTWVASYRERLGMQWQYQAEDTGASDIRTGLCRSSARDTGLQPP